MLWAGLIVVCGTEGGRLVPMVSHAQHRGVATDADGNWGGRIWEWMGDSEYLMRHVVVTQLYR